MIIKKTDAIEFEKQGVKMRVYNSKDQCPEASVVYQETNIWTSMRSFIIVKAILYFT